MERLIFHVDVNSAFLSWEAVRRVKNGEPDIRLIPSCVGGDPGSRRGIVVAKSIPAKKYHVTTGEPVSLALRKCPSLLVVPSDFRLYAKCSRDFKEICRRYAPVVEEFSIDECFLDFTGTSRIYPDPIALAREIKDRIREELGFTVNVGIGRNKLCAKMASDFEKPDKVHTLFPEEIEEKLWPLPVRDLLFIGKASAQKLEEAGIFTIGQLARSDPAEMAALLGTKMSIQARNYANGIDDSPVREHPEEAKGYSNEITLEEDVTTMEVAETILRALTDSVTRHMRSEGAKTMGVSVSIRYLDFKTRSHQKTLQEPLDTSREIYEIARELLGELWKDQRPLRLMGISLTNLSRGDYGRQMTFFEEDRKKDRERDEKLDRTMDELKDRFGSEIIKRGSVMSLGIHVAKKFNGRKDS
ncbi:MAG: DNA polymerase IV [Parasporobacterium sp.]|nr:DNA polymerase IV [Parasporobacterium sp.]